LTTQTKLANLLLKNVTCYANQETLVKPLIAAESKINQTTLPVFTPQLAVNVAKNATKDLAMSRKDANSPLYQKKESVLRLAIRILIVLPLIINSNSKRNASKQFATKILEAAKWSREKIVLNVEINVNFLLTAHKESLELFAALIQERRNVPTTYVKETLTANVKKENGDTAEKEIVETNATANHLAK